MRAQRTGYLPVPHSDSELRDGLEDGAATDLDRVDGYGEGVGAFDMAMSDCLLQEQASPDQRPRLPSERDQCACGSVAAVLILTIGAPAPQEFVPGDTDCYSSRNPANSITDRRGELQTVRDLHRSPPVHHPLRERLARTSLASSSSEPRHPRCHWSVRDKWTRCAL